MLSTLFILTAHAGDFPYPVHTQTLENGCTVVIIPMPSKGVVSTAVWMSVGARNEIEPGRTGFAHFFEHLLFSGTETMKGPEREKALLRLGIGDNAWTWLDETVYTATVDTRSLDPFLGMQADMFMNLDLTTDHVRKEAGAVYGEFRKTQADPEFHLGQAVRSSVYTTHTYAHDALGFEADIAAMPSSHDYALSFFAKWYRPTNATIILAGDLTGEEGLQMVDKHFGAWKGQGEDVVLEVPAEPAQLGPIAKTLAWPSPTPPLVEFAWRIPAHSDTDPDSAALTVAEGLLLGSTGTLSNRLIREEGLAIAVHGGAEANVDPGMFTIFVRAKEGADQKQIEAIVQEEILTLVDGVDAAILERTRSHERYRSLTRLDDPASVVNSVGSQLRRGASPDALGRFDAMVASVDGDQLAEVVGSFLIPEKRTTIWLTHEAKTNVE